MGSLMTNDLQVCSEENAHSHNSGKCFWLSWKKIKIKKYPNLNNMELNFWCSITEGLSITDFKWQHTFPKYFAGLQLQENYMEANETGETLIAHYKRSLWQAVTDVLRRKKAQIRVSLTFNICYKTTTFTLRKPC